MRFMGTGHPPIKIGQRARGSSGSFALHSCDFSRMKMLPFVLNGLKVSGGIINDTGKLLSGHALVFAGGFDCLSYRLEINFFVNFPSKGLTKRNTMLIIRII